jgi:hypothetical protein
MDEQRIDMVLKLLGECIPRAPEKTVEKMVKTVNALEEQRGKNEAFSNGEDKPQKEKHKELNIKEIGGPKL